MSEKIFATSINSVDGPVELTIEQADILEEVLSQSEKRTRLLNEEEEVEIGKIKKDFEEKRRKINEEFDSEILKRIGVRLNSTEGQN